MEAELKEKFVELGNTFEEYKKTQDECVKKEEINGHVEPLLKEKEEVLNEKMGNIEDEIAKIKSSQGWKAAELDEKEDKASEIYGKYFKKGFDSLTTVEKDEMLKLGQEFNAKANFSGSDPDGGFVVRPTLSNRINQDVKENSPIRQIADVTTIGTNEWVDNYDESDVGYGWVGEKESRDVTTSPTLNEIRIPVNEMYAKPEATQNLLDDAIISIEQWLQTKISDRFSRAEGTAFVSGDGVKQPKGILSYTAGDGFDQIEQVTSASSGAVSFDDLIGTTDALLDSFKPNARWIMNKETRSYLRKLKYPAGSQEYIWQPDSQGGIASMLLGYPVTIAVDMPTLTNSALAIAFGDFRRGYKILDRQGLRVLRDPFSNKPFVQFYTTKRVGGGVQHFQAIKLLKVKA